MKRRTWHTQVNKRGELQGKQSPRMDFETVKVIEVLPGDPPDLDAFIAQAVRMFELTNPLIELDERELGITRMRFEKARHGEGGEG